MNNPLSNGGLKLFYSRFLELNSRWPWWYIWVLWPPVMAWQLYNAFFHSAAATILTQQAAVGGAGYVPLANYTVGASPMDVAPWFTRPMIDVTADSLTFAAIPKAVVATTMWNIFTTFVMGLGIWTFAEYLLHRFVFHFEPHGNFGNWFHYFAHGIHHVTPNDSSRLTFPPLFASVIAFGCHFLFLAHIHKLAKVATCPCQGLYAGILCGYLLYDTAHFFFHNSDFDNRIFRALKTAHMNHHYKNDERNFGVTSPFWDHVFRTWDPQTGKDRAGSGKKRAASAKKAL
jgi:sterol desaturase/sphingolipid hydroxylase (fatty acid hydroxylase superfamily)